MVLIMCELFRFSLGQLQITVIKTEEKSLSIREKELFSLQLHSIFQILTASYQCSQGLNHHP